MAASQCGHLKLYQSPIREKTMKKAILQVEELERRDAPSALSVHLPAAQVPQQHQAESPDFVIKGHHPHHFPPPPGHFIPLTIIH
jgi:hypothetical protein